MSISRTLRLPFIGIVALVSGSHIEFFLVRMLLKYLLNPP